MLSRIDESVAITSTNQALAKYCDEHSKPLIKITGFVGGYKGDKSRCHVYCEFHGCGDNFENVWQPRLNHLRRSKDIVRKGTNFGVSGCPKCSGNYRYTSEEYRQLINEKLASTRCQLIDFASTKVNTRTRCKIYCETHGNCWEFENPSIPSIAKVLHRDASCSKCNKSYLSTESELIKLTTDFFVSSRQHLSTKGVVGAFQGKQSKVLIECTRHGLLADFKNPSTPTFETLEKRSFDCPKCTGLYHPTAKEAINELSQILPRVNLKFKAFKDGYTGRSSRCELICRFHGDLSKHEGYSFPDLDALLNAKVTCFLCARERHTLTHLLKNPAHFEIPRKLYYLELLDSVTHKTIAYKIGVSIRELSLRYHERGLSKRGLELGKVQELMLPNVLCLLAEVIILARFHQFKTYPEQLRNWGMTECFGEDILNINSRDMLQEYSESAKQLFHYVLNTSNLSHSTKEKARQAWTAMGYPSVESTTKVDPEIEFNLRRVLSEKSK